METNKWFVKKQVHEWQFVDELDMFCWVTISDEIITPMRATEEEANNDFINLGFKIKDKAVIQCHDEIKLNKSWVRHIVQTKTIN